MTRVPAIWTILCRHLAIDPPVAKRLWHALATSERSRCVALKSAVLLGESGSALLEPLTLLQRHAAPAQLIPCFEELVQIGALARQEVSRIEEAILHKTTPTGRWRLSHERAAG